MGAYGYGVLCRVFLFSVDALNNAGSNASETASLAVGGRTLDAEGAMLLLEDGHLAVGFQERVLLFEADGLRRAMLETMHNVPANASLVTKGNVTSMALLEGGHLAVGTLYGGVLLFEWASVSRALLESKHSVTPNASLAVDDEVTALELLKGGHLAVGTDLSGVLLFEAAGMSRAIRGAMRDVQANASLAAGRGNSLQLLEGGHLGVPDDSEGVVLLFESSSISRALLGSKQNVTPNASLAADYVTALELLKGGHLAEGK